MISFVYFDIGGVLIKDFGSSEGWTKLKKDIGLKEEFSKEFDDLYSMYEQAELCLNRDIDTLIPIFTDKFGINFPAGYSLMQDMVNRFEINDSIWPLVFKLKEKVKLGLLTNICPRMLDAYFKRGIMPPIKWDAIIDSSVVGYQKPDVEIYKIAEEKSKTKKEEILFIDDIQKNIDAAADFGWQTILYDRNDTEKSNKLIYSMCKELL